jgi:hypothetical protein
MPLSLNCSCRGAGQAGVREPDLDWSFMAGLSLIRRLPVSLPSLSTS